MLPHGSKFSPNLAVVLFFIFGMADVESTPSLEPDEFPGLLQLLQLKEQECDYAVWCTLNGTGQIDRRVFSSQCCAPCSCDADCHRNNNNNNNYYYYYNNNNNNMCCPDYRLSQYLDGVVYDTVHDLSRSMKDRALRGDGTTGTHVSSDSAVDVKDSPDTDSATECVRLQVLSDSPYRPAGISYKVITRCTSTQADPAFTPLCEDLTNTNRNVSLALRLTPVQTSSTTVYRNVFCYRCSAEKSTSFVKWRARLVTGHGYKEYFSLTTFNTADELFESILRSGLDINGAYNIIFEPQEGDQTIDPDGTCDVVDVNTCDNVTAYSRKLVDACERYFAPIDVYMSSQGTYVTLNNIACLQCNPGMEQDAVCRGNTYNPGPFMSMRLSKEAHMATYGTGATFLDIVFDEKGKCKAGYALDKTKDRCRKVYCPSGYIIAGKSCVPLFDDFRGLYYAVYLSAASRSPNGTSYTWTDVYQIIAENYAKTTSDGFTVHDFSVWKAVSDDTNIIAHIVFWTDKPAVDILRWNLLKEPVFSLSSNRLPFANSLVQSKGSLVDSLSQVVYIKPYPEARYFPMSNVTLLTSDDFCFRIRTDQDEVQRTGKIAVVKTDKQSIVLPTPNFLYDERKGLPLTCAENLLILPTDKQFYDEVSAVRVLDDFEVEEDVSFVTKGTALSIFIGSTIFLLVVVYVLQHKCVYRSRPSTAIELELRESTSNIP